MLTDSFLRLPGLCLTIGAVLVASPVFAQDAPPAEASDETVTPQPALVEGQVWAVAGEGESSRIVVSFGIAGFEDAPPTPECWANGSVDFTAGPDCLAAVPAGDLIPAEWNAGLPAAFALATPNGWCVPTLGEPTLYNTAECENGYQLGLPIRGCDDVAPLALGIESAAAVEAWPALHWAGVVFGEQESVDVATIAARADLPREVLTWWSPIVERYQYGEETVDGAVRIGRASIMGREWLSVSSAAHLPGENCTDLVLFHGGAYLNTAQGLRTTSRAGVLTGYLHATDGELLYGVHTTDSSTTLFSLEDPLNTQWRMQLRFRQDNEECASRSSEAWLESDCAP